MVDPTREEGFLVIERVEGGLSALTKFQRTEEEAESAAKKLVEDDSRALPVYVVSVTRFATERIRQMRGSSF